MGAISQLTGDEPTGKPEAELWLGAHPGSPSVIADPRQTGAASDLATWIATDPDAALGAGRPEGEPRLPFLLKVLAAASPLSLQAHPTPDRAVEGFLRENDAGIPVDAPTRNYRDPFPKPELIFALEDGFRALCGFRSVALTHSAIERLIELDTQPTAGGPDPMREWLAGTEKSRDLRATFEWLISRGDGVDALIARVVAVARAHPDEFGTIVALAHAYPGDPGILISLMLNEVSLKRGEVLYLAAGNIHAYLSGIGIELMTASDNVLRGGLTPKHIDVAELLDVLDFDPVTVPYLAASPAGVSSEVFSPGAGFELVVIGGSALLTLAGPAIALCTSGRFTLSGQQNRTEIMRGQSVYITPDELTLAIEGSGELFVARSSER
jgi:mannose-6-phosphate isomerase